MPRVIHFELTADNPERAVKFYSDVFGWQIEKWGNQDYWLVNTGSSDQPGINGAIMRRQGSLARVINSIDVPSVDDFSDKIKKTGGKMVTPKTPIPGIGYFAYCQDTEGNIFGIMQSDPKAK
jgi:predicted enzyme related to lactoylglutathione lyase